MPAPVPIRYRLIVGAVLLAAFVVFWGLYEFELLGTYARILIFLGVPVKIQTPFLDLHGVLAAAECYRQGVDVYVANPCDVMNRVHIYSPLWLTLIPSKWSTADTWWAGAVLAIAFLLSLAWLCPARSQRELWLFLALCCSSTVVFVTERGNIDIVVFILILIAGKIFASERLRPISYGAVLLATALKFYPFAAFAMMVADRPRRALVLGGLGVGLALGLAFLWHREIAVASATFPVGYLRGFFSARNLVGTLLTLYPQRFMFLEQYGGAVTSFLIVLAVLAAAGLAIILRRKGVQLFLGLEETVLFLGGGSMIVACFFVGHNIHYRAILLLLTLPLLLACTRDITRSVRLTGWIGIILVAFAVFENFMRLNIIHAVRAANGPEYRAILAFWALEEIMWWTLVTSLTSALFLIAWDSPVGVWARRIVRSRAAIFTTTQRA